MRNNLKSLAFIFFVASTFLVNAQSTFIPSDLGGLQLWLSADSGVVYDTVTNKISSWQDLSGNGNNAVQGNPGSQPLYISSSTPLIDYKPAINFDGSTTYFTFSPINNIRTVFWIIRESPTATINARALLGHSSSYDFHRGFAKEFWRPTATNANVYNGNLRVNTLSKNGFTDTVPVQYAIISLVTNGNVNASNFSLDQNTAGREWDGQLAELIIYNQPLTVAQVDSVEKYLDTKYAPPVNLGPDIVMTTLCDTMLDASPRFTSYKWHRGNNLAVIDSNQTFMASQPGKYWVQTRDVFGFSSVDTIYVSYSLNQLQPNNLICNGDTLHWDTNLNPSNYTFLWSDNSTGAFIDVTQAGQYSVIATENATSCFLTSDTILVTVDSFPLIASLGSDTALCSGNIIGLVQGAAQASNYLWSNSQTTATIPINSTGTYSLIAQDVNGCTKYDTIHVVVSGTAPITNFTFNNPCLGDSVFFLDTSIPQTGIITAWLWDFGDGATDTIPNPHHLFSTSGIHSVSLFVTNSGGCSNSVIKNATLHVLPVVDFAVQYPACQNTAIDFTDQSSISTDVINNWQWHFGDSSGAAVQDTTHTYVSSGNYLVELVVTSDQGCKDSITKPVSVFPCNYPNQITGLQLWLSADAGVTFDTITNKVSLWKDLSVLGNDASQANPTAQPLYLNVSTPLMNYRPAMSFDGNNAYFIFNSIASVRSVFWIIRESPTASVNARALLGHSSAFDFHRGYAKEFWRPVATNPNVFNGSLRVNEAAKNGFTDTVPVQYSIISLVTTGNVSASNFSRDQNLSGREWNGELAELIIYDQPLSNAQVKIVEDYLHYKYAPPVDIGSDLVMTTLCDTSVDASPRFTSYQWHRGNDPAVIGSGQSLTVSEPGKYWVEVTDIFGFTSADTVQVTYPLHEPLLNNLICFGDTLNWNTNLSPSDYTFLWSDNSTNSFIDITQAGKYAVTATETSTGCILNSDTVTLSIDSFPLIASLGNDSISLCIGNTIGLVQGASLASSYLWSTNATTAAIQINTSGTYSLLVQDTYGCTKTDSIFANIVGLPPVAGFSANSVCLGTATQFSDSSFDPAPGDSIVSWHWNFDDATTDSLQNPSHLFPTSGNHAAVLTVISSLGCPGIDTASILIHAIPASSFTNTKPCTLTDVQFTGTSTIASGDTINGWVWSFGDPASGTNSSIIKNPTHLFDTTGNFVVSLITTSTFGCADTAFHVLLVKRSSVPNFQYSPTCYGNLVQFTNLSSPALLDTAWRWDFGDGTGLSPIENPAHLYAFAQTYFVMLFVYASTGCVTAATLPVTVSPIPIANFTHATACINTLYHFNDSSSISAGSITGWNWNIGGLKTDTVQNTVFTFSDTGNYTIVHTVTSDIGCTKTISRTIHVSPSPVVNFSFNPQYGNPPLLVSYTNLSNNVNTNTYNWSFGDGATSTFTNPSHQYIDTSLFAIKLVATSSQGCKDSAVKNIYVIRPILDLAITGLSSSYITDNHLHVKLNLANLGTRAINNFKIEAHLADGTPVQESFAMSLPTGYSGQLELSSAFDLGSRSPEYFCVHALDPNGTTDDVVLNDEMCKSLSNDFFVPNPYPNPFNDNLVLQMILPYKGEVSIELFDLSGKNISIYEGTGHEGLNQYQAELGDLSNGPYAIRFKFKDAEIIKTIVKIEKKN